MRHLESRWVMVAGALGFSIASMGAPGRHSKGADGMDLTKGLVGHWRLAGDCRDHSGRGNHAVNRGVDLGAVGPGGARATAAGFNGRDAWLEVPANDSLSLGAGDFAFTAWVHTDAVLDDVLGDIASQYDPEARKGFNLGLMCFPGVTSTQSNHRNVHFGIDNARVEPWQDCGRPGSTLFVCALAVHDGALYAGTFETGAEEAGHVYRYEGGTTWIDCGSPDRANAVICLAQFRDRLYAGTACYRARGSLLPDSPNTHPGGVVYRYEGGRTWTPCGRLGEANDVYALTVFRGTLFAIPMYTPGVFRLEGESTWVLCGIPGGQRGMALAVQNGHLYSTGNGSAGVWRTRDGSEWEDCGRQGEETQTYSVAIYEGRMHVGTWPSGAVFRHEGGTHWSHRGRMGEEKEVMAMAVYNGKLYGGTLPAGDVYRHDGESAWTRVGELDHTPDVTYRRVWSMAVYRGRLFAGTLPSGRVHSFEAGRNVTLDRELAPGWRHLAAVKAGGELRLYVDGELAARSARFDPAEYDLSNGRPLKIGFGSHDYFNGRLCDVRLYRHALGDQDVAALAGRK